MVAAFWAGIPVEVTQEAGIFPRCRRAAIRTLFQSPNTTCRETVGLFYPCPQVVESCPTRIVGLVSIFGLVKTTFVILTYVKWRRISSAFREPYFVKRKPYFVKTHEVSFATVVE